MIVLVALIGICGVLWLPYVGKLICHGIIHVVIHFIDHHDWMPVTLASFLWILLVAIFAALIAQTWYVVGWIAMTFLILYRLFTAH